ncbi:hypothetical protein ACFOPX_06580 [Helicobacter baculiformis]|uniref:Uncharacterized protein n=1 Tax=Helicobacter baculiformis TaxID=427351 RepID=A0ABV7ZJ69_9HELI
MRRGLEHHKQIGKLCRSIAQSPHFDKGDRAELGQLLLDVDMSYMRACEALETLHMYLVRKKDKRA